MHIDSLSYPIEDKDLLYNFYHEIWNDNEYLRYGIDIRPGDTVVDLGSCIGLFSLLAQNKGAGKILSFEVNYKFYKHLVINTCTYKNILTYFYRIGHKHITLEHIINTHKLEKIDLVKIDIEGDEYDLLLNTPNHVFEKIDQFTIEFHFSGYFEKKADKLISFLKILEILSKNNYKINYEHIHKDYNIAMLYAKKYK